MPPIEPEPKRPAQAQAAVPSPPVATPSTKPPVADQPPQPGTAPVSRIPGGALSPQGPGGVQATPPAPPRSGPHKPEVEGAPKDEGPGFTESPEATVAQGQQAVRDLYGDYQRSFDPKASFRHGYRQSLEAQRKPPPGAPPGAQSQMDPLGYARAAGRGLLEAGKARWNQHRGDVGGKRLTGMIEERQKKEPGHFGPYQPEVAKRPDRWSKKRESMERQLGGSTQEAVERVEQGRANMRRQWAERQSNVVNSMFDYLNGVASRSREQQAQQRAAEQEQMRAAQQAAAQPAPKSKSSAKKANTMDDDHLLKALRIRKNGGDSAAVAYLATELKTAADVSDAQAEAIAKDALAGDVALYKALKEPSGGATGDNSTSAHDPKDDPTAEDEPDDDEENPIKGKGTVVGTLERPEEMQPAEDPMDRAGQQTNKAAYRMPERESGSARDTLDRFNVTRHLSEPPPSEPLPQATRTKAALGERLVGDAGSELGRDRRRDLGSDEPRSWTKGDEEEKCGDTPPEDCGCHGNQPKPEPVKKRHIELNLLPSYAKWAGRLVKNDDEDDDEDDDEEYDEVSVGRRGGLDVDIVASRRLKRKRPRTKKLRKQDMRGTRDELSGLSTPDKLSRLQKLMWLSRSTNNPRKAHPKQLQVFEKLYRIQEARKAQAAVTKAEPQRPGTPEDPAEHAESPQAPLDAPARPNMPEAKREAP